MSSSTLHLTAPATPGEAELRALFEGNWKPRRPYATDNLAWGIRRMGRDAALLLAYIEASPSVMLTFLIVDIDHPDALLRALSANGNHPMPNLIITNPFNGHAHAVWILATPVCRTEYARRNVLAYAASVLEGLRRAVDGDRRYSGLLVKNPLAGSWATQYMHDHLWTLGELEAALQAGGHMPPKDWRQQRARKADPCGLGRNCTLFDGVRLWAYREVRHHFGDPDGFKTVLRAGVAERNLEFSIPLPAAEARAIADSIHRWITTRSRIWTRGPQAYDDTFRAIQAARGRKGGLVGGQARGRSQTEARLQRLALLEQKGY
ncbi:replication initiation protein [Pseudonocardia sp. ICBG1142]|uniref:replication initiation protein n=1 Tax=Pseudonocardia sp. ICBG1142 TaxID=2846760 RepID=UPI001CF62145|nr:replication initiation protein [Pseudonocardia sp. ICBG1142]